MKSDDDIRKRFGNARSTKGIVGGKSAGSKGKFLDRSTKNAVSTIRTSSRRNRLGKLRFLVGDIGFKIVEIAVHVGEEFVAFGKERTVSFEIAIKLFHTFTVCTLVRVGKESEGLVRDFPMRHACRSESLLSLAEFPLIVLKGGI